VRETKNRDLVLKLTPDGVLTNNMQRSRRQDTALEEVGQRFEKLARSDVVSNANDETDTDFD
jgi:hypothetical protein